MVKNIKNKEINITIKEEHVELPEQIRKDIENYWNNEVIKSNPNLWNGEVTCITDYIENDNTIELICKKSDYAHYIYDERIGLPKGLECFNIAAGALLETSDGYYIVGELDKNTSYPYCLQISGGNVDKADGNDLMKTIRREVKEELNIDVEDKSQVENSLIAYINFPDEKVHAYEVFTKGILKMTAKEMEEYYNNYLNYLKENDLEIEFGKIHFIKKNRVIEELSKLRNPKRVYVEDLLITDASN